jgi:uncharacterized protein YndB with AHSA1/START domain
MAVASSVSAPERTLVTTRVFDAPRELVYRAWTDPKQLARWFPPEGFTTAACELDVRPGGAVRIDFQAPAGPPFDGAVMPGRGVYREVVPNERLAFTLVPEIGDQKMPVVLTTVFFEDAGSGRTRLTIHQSAESVAEFEQLTKTGMKEGIAQSLGKLAGVLSGNPTDRGVTVSGRQLTIVRVFRAPRDLVWTAFTDPAQVTKWMFSNGWESPLASMDLRSGGAFSVRMRPADRSEEGFDFSGTFKEVKKPERIVQVIGDGRVMTTTFEEVLGGTKLTLSLEMSEGEAQERGGWGQILDHLAAHLATQISREAQR